MCKLMIPHVASAATTVYNIPSRDELEPDSSAVVHSSAADIARACLVSPRSCRRCAAVERTLYRGFETQGVQLPIYEQTTESARDVEANLRAVMRLNRADHKCVEISEKCVEMLKVLDKWRARGGDEEKVY